MPFRNCCGAVKLSGALFFHAQCARAVVRARPPSKAFGRYIGTPASHIIEFHLIAEGRGYVRVGEETTPLTAGDIIMIPHGDAHYMGNGLGARADRWRDGHVGAGAR